MNLNTYQEQALITQGSGATSLEYLTLGLVGEAGEVANKVKKILRGDYQLEDVRVELMHEIGDCLWYIAVLAEAIDYNLDYVAQRNLEKLIDREKNGTIKGSGDKR